MREYFFRFPGGRTKCFTLSFDDGKVQDRELVAVLNRYGLKATFNLMSGRLDEENHITKAEVNTLYQGHEIACHTMHHPHLWNLDAAGMADEILRDRHNLEELTGGIVCGMAYPYGLQEDETVVPATRACGIVYSRTTRSTYDFRLPKDFLLWHPTSRFFDPERDELIDQFLSPDPKEDYRIVPRLCYIWSHSFEFTEGFDPMEEMAKKVSGHEEIWYATNMEVYRYCMAYRSLVRSADGRFVYNPSAIDVFIHVHNKNICIHPGETRLVDR